MDSDYSAFDSFRSESLSSLLKGSSAKETYTLQHIAIHCNTLQHTATHILHSIVSGLKVYIPFTILHI